MKSRFLSLLIVLALVLSMALCACNGTGENDPASTSNNTENTSENSNPSETPDDSGEAQVEPTDKGLFVTEPTNTFPTFSSGFPAVVLPEEEFGDDVEGVSSSRPLDAPPEESTDETEPTTAPTYSGIGSTTLPEHVFED